MEINQKGNNYRTVPMLLLLLLGASGCNSSPGGSSSGNSGSGSSGLNLLSNQTAGSTITNADGSTCTQVIRDTSSCQSAREALGLSGHWLSFSCDVTLGLATSALVSTTTYSSASYVSVTTQSLPDHKSNYYPTSGSYSFTANGNTYSGNYSDIHTSYVPSFPDPNSITQKQETFYIPINPTASGTVAMQGGPIGIAIDGTNIYSSVAANTDNIFAEADSFDSCQGHPDGNSRFHYHSEPYSITYDDNHLIGVMRDGYFIFGRRDYDNTVPGNTTSLDAAKISSDIYKYGGHIGADPVTGTGSIFHYHLTEWVGCYDEPNHVKASDDGETYDMLNSPSQPSCGGTWVDTWFLAGHGNGGAFMTVPSGLGAQAPSQTTAGIRYYYGKPGSCSGC